MISVMIGIHNKTAGFLPCVPRPITDWCSQNLACLINTDIVRVTFFSGKNILQEIKDVGWRFSLGKFGPSNDNTTWCTDSLNTVKPIRRKVVFSLDIFRCIFIMWILNSRTRRTLPGLMFTRALENATDAIDSRLISLLNILPPLRCMVLTSLSWFNFVIWTANYTTFGSKFKLMIRAECTTTSILKIRNAVRKSTMLVKIYIYIIGYNWIVNQNLLLDP